LNEPWTLETYRDARGREPVTEFIESLRPPMQAKVRRNLAALRDSGNRLGMPLARPISGYRFWELRTQMGNDITRIFYFAVRGRRIVLLHGFEKRTPRTPRSEVDVAAARLDDFLRRDKG
jgi:phage-related protein